MDKTLDEALDEFDRWGEELSEELARMTPAQRQEYFAHVLEQLRHETGFALDLPRVPAPKPASVNS